MDLSKRQFNTWVKEKSKAKALFDREVDDLFNQFRKACVTIYFKPPKGITKKIFKKWLLKAGFIMASNRRRRTKSTQKS